MKKLLLLIPFFAFCGQANKNIHPQTIHIMDSLTIRHINPDGLIRNPAFTNVITVQGSANPDYLVGIDAIAIVPGEKNDAIHP